MTDLFRGYDLTSVVEHAARNEYNRFAAANPEVLSWEDLGAVDKLNFKARLLPIITDVLDALESDQVKPIEAKSMREYAYQSSETDRLDPRFYENVETMHDKESCTVWVMHMSVHPSLKNAVLERMSVLLETTGEYTYGDSWREWGEPTEDDADRHLAVYFDATPAKAQDVGFHLANHVAIAAMRAAGGDNADINYAVSTSGDYAEQLEPL